MATQYTSILKLALPVTGELAGTWGDVVNNNITSMVEQAIAGLSTINTWTANAHTLTVADGTTSESRCAMLVAADGSGGTALTAAGEIICPAASKLYVLKNGSSYAVTLKTAAGTGVAVPAGDTAFLFCDGTNVNSCVTTVVNGHISGNLTVDGNTTLGNATTDTVTVTAQFNTDLLPSTDNARDLGSTAKSWRTLYCDTSVLVGNLSLSGNTLSSTDTNGNIVIAPNGTGDVQLDADTVRVGDSNANATITTNGTGDLILNTNAGTNSGSITIEDGVNGNIIIAPNGTGQVQITNAALDLTTIEVSNINAKDGTAAITIADSTGAVGISTAVTMSATTQNIALGTSQTTGTFTVGGAAQTGALTLDQSTKTHTLNLGTGATESGLTKTINLGTGGVATSTTAITIGSTNGTTTTLNGTVTAATFNSTTIDTTNLEVTNIKAKDGTAALSIADSTGVVSVSANPVLSGGTANGVAYLNGSKVLTTGSALTFDGTLLRSTTYLALSTNTTPDTSTGDAIFYKASVGATLSGFNLVFETGSAGSRSEQMRLTSTGLGIGTTTFASGSRMAVQTTSGKFDVRAYGGASVQLSSSAALGYSSAVGNGHIWEIGGFTNMTLDSSGNLGLGVTPSVFNTGRAFEVGFAGSALFASSLNNFSLLNNANFAVSNQFVYSANGTAQRLQLTSGEFRFLTAPSGTAGNAITFTQAMTLDASGRLFVGNTTAPGSGEIKQVLSRAGNTFLEFQNSTTNTGCTIGTINENFIIFTNTGALGSETYTERARITSGGLVQVSSGGSVQIGGTAARATTAGTNRLDIFNGTAPVGTLTNGISIYSSSGEAYVMDAAGNATLFSPHDSETNEWIFKSKHTPTGKTLKIDVEKLLRFINDHFGLDAVHEFIEE